MTAQTVSDFAASTDVVEVVNPAGEGGFLIVCEHASPEIPAEFGGLGLDSAALRSHIAWDPGARQVAEALSSLLDAPFVVQKVSRLLYDCNRPPESASAVPEVSEIYQVPGNTGLTSAERRARANRFYEPFRRTLSDCIERRMAAGRPPVMVTVHSFTPVFKGVRREVELGILHDTDTRLADALMDAAMERQDIVVRRNEPYGRKDGVCHTLAEHGVSRGLLNVMLEIRNDLIAGSADQTAMAEWLARCLAQALGALKNGSRGRELA